jgi:dGTPase
MGENWGKANTLEGEVCKIADAVAYINHDIDDAIRAEFITEGDLPESAIRLLGHTRSERINAMVCDIVDHSWAVKEQTPPLEPVIQMGSDIREATRILHEFLYKRVYIASSAQPDAEHARKTIRSLYRFFNEHRELLPPEYLSIKDNPEHQVVDYIASMTDQYALRTFQELDL